MGRILIFPALFSVAILALSSIAGCGGDEEEKANTAPVIISFQADPATVNVNEHAILTVTAEDAESDPLTCTYQPSGGTITGSGGTVTWIAPETVGSYAISVDVSDGNLIAQSTVTITVAAVPQDEPVEQPTEVPTEQPTEVPTEESDEKPVELRIQWIGHSCFLITSSDGTRVLTDPFGASVGYPVPSVETDVVLVSHSHSDHNNVSMAKGSPEVVRTQGESTAAGISFLGVMSDHDDVGGASRGKSIIFVWEMDGMRLAHLGDLGQPELRDDQLAEIGDVDILFIPVGGFYTIDAEQATRVIEQLSAKLVFPMHYKTEVANLPIATVDGFLADKNDVEMVNGNTIVIEELPEEMKIIVLDYK